MVFITAGVAASDEEAALVIQKRREHKDKSIPMDFRIGSGHRPGKNGGTFPPICPTTIPEKARPLPPKKTPFQNCVKEFGANF